MPKVVEDCHELLRWLTPHLDKFPRNRRFTLSERLETELLEVLAACVNPRSNGNGKTYCCLPNYRRVLHRMSMERDIEQWR